MTQLDPASSVAPASSVPAATEGDLPASYPVLPGQRDIYLGMQLSGDDPSRYNTGLFVTVDGVLDPERANASLREVIAQAEALRAVFTMSADGELRQHLLPADRWQLHVLDIAAADADERMRTDMAVPMDIHTGPLTEVSLLLLDDETTIIYLKVHHLVSDGVGLIHFLRTLTDRYSRLDAGEPPAIRGWDLASIVDAAQSYRSGPQFAADRGYWVDRMADLPEPVRLLSADLAPGTGVTHARWEIPVEQLTPLRALASRAGVRPALLLIAASIAFARTRSGRDDLVVALPVTGRLDRLTRTAPSMVTSVLPLRVTASGRDTLADLARRTDRALYGLLAHSRFRSEDLGRALAEVSDRDTPYRMFGLGVNVMADTSRQTVGGFDATAHALASGPVSDVEIQIQLRRKDMPAEVVLRAVDGAAAEVADLAEAFSEFLAALAAHPDRRLSALFAGAGRSHDDPSHDDTGHDETVGPVAPPPAVHRMRTAGIEPEDLPRRRITARAVSTVTDEDVVSIVEALWARHGALRTTLARPVPILWTLTTAPVEGATPATAEFDAASGTVSIEVDPLLVDAVSARILESDLQTAFDDLGADRAVVIDPVPVSPAKAAAEIGAGAGDVSALATWMQILAPGAGLPLTGTTSADPIVLRSGVTDAAGPLLAADPESYAPVVAGILAGDADLLVDLVADLRPAAAARTVGPFQALRPARIRVGEAVPAPPAGPALDVLRFLSPQVSTALIAATASGEITDPQVLIGDYGLPTGHAVRVAVRRDGHTPGRPVEGTGWTVEVIVDPGVVADAEETTRRIAEAVVEHADAVAAELDQRVVDDETRARLEAEHGAIDEVWPLSPLQEGLYYQAQVDADSDIYTAQFWLDFDHRLDADRMREAARRLLRTNPELRALFVEHAGRPLQLISRDVAVDLRVEDLGSLTPAEAASRLEDILVADRAAAFDLTRAPLWRMIVVHMPGGHDRLVVNRRFMLWDGWSGGLFVSRLLALLDGTPVPPREASLGDYLAWIARTDVDEAHRAWSEHLAGYSEPSLIAPRAAGAQPRAPRRIEVDLGAELSDRLREAARSAGVTLNSVLSAALTLTLSRVLGRTDIAFGSTVAGRPTEVPGLDTVIGLFLNTVPVRTVLRADEPLRDLLRRTQDDRIGLMAYDHVGLAELQQLSGHPILFDVLYVLQNFRTEDEEAAASARHGLLGEGSLDHTHYPVALVVAPGRTIGFRLEYRDDLVDEQTARGMAERFRRLLDLVGTHLDAPVGALDLTLEGDAPLVGPIHDLPTATVSELLAERAAEIGSADALVFEDRRLTYAELDAEVDRCAQVLGEHGVGPETVVALAIPRTIETVVALFAILRAGGAYLPLELDHPDDRLHGIIDDASPALILTHSAVADRFGALGLRALEVDRLPEPRDATWHAPRVDPDSPAYVIYTSGSTGRPKGVVTPYRGLTNMQLNHREKVFEPAIGLARDAGVTGRLRIAHTVSFAFDMSWEELLWLVEGHEVHVCDEDLRRDSAALVAYCGTHRIDVINVTPTYCAQLIADGLLDGAHVPPLVLLGGEAVSEPVWTRLREHPFTFGYNLYGPTEYTINTLGIGTDESPTSSVGTPIWNTTAHLLDPWLRPVPRGVAGELYISGAGMARGYLGRPDLTADRFVADPFSVGGRLYRTGDLMRVRPDGNLDFLGRTDDQVKVRGHRVELAEIDAALTALPEIAASAVVAAADPSAPGAKRLVAYVIWADPESRAEFTAVRRALAESLPDYMVPSLFAAVAEFPMTVNGKLDVKALPAPQPASTRREPRTDLERRLCELIADVLGLESEDGTCPVGVDSDFFELGGHSMSAMRLVAAVRTDLGAELAIRDLFEARTAAELAERVTMTGSTSDIPLADRTARIPLSAAQERLWLLYELDPGDVAYHYGHVIRIDGELDADALRGAVTDLLIRHESLRTLVDDASGEPAQRILDVEDIPDVVEAHTARAGAPVESLTEHAREFLTRPFALRDEPPIRLSVTTIPATGGEVPQSLVCLAMHHIATDEWSDRPLLEDLTVAYLSRAAGQRPAFAPLPIQYADFTVWQRDRIAELAEPQLDHWAGVLSGAPDELTLPYDRPRRPGAVSPAASTSVVVPPSLRAPLGDLAQAGGASMFMVTQAAVATLLHRVGAGDDILLGSPISGRTDPALDDLIGFFVGTQVLRADLAGRPAFTDLLAQVRTADLAAFDNQDIDFGQVVERLAPPRVVGRNPLFQTSVSYLPLDAMPGSFLGLPATFAPLTSVAAKFDLSFTFVDVSATGEMTVSLEYATDLFDDATAEALLTRLVRVLEAVAADPTARVDTIDLLSENELTRVRRLESGPAAADPALTVTELLRAARLDHAEEVAVLDTEGRSLTYAQFGRAADRLAARLHEAGVDPDGESIVAVIADRGVAQLVSLHAVLHAGAAYLPIDADLPAARIAAILDDADIAAAICVGSEHVPAEHMTFGVLVVDDEQVLADAEPASSGTEATVVRPDNPAYVIYTSGSTGTPKGVVVGQRAAANVLRWRRDTMPGGPLGPGDRVLVKTPVGFDGAVWELLLPFMCGATAVIAEPGAQRDPRRQAQIIADFGVSTSVFVPSLLEHFVEHVGRTPTLRHIIAGGEALTGDLTDRVLRAASSDPARVAPLHLINAYGPTETTVVVTDHVERSGDENPARAANTGSVAIGTPVAGTDLLVLDASLRRVPEGAVGELYVRGTAPARGYLGRAGLTAATFVADPTGESPGARVYRTGDLVRRVDGVLHYRGRADSQVKVRGNRVEIGEVEAVIRGLAGVENAAVDVRDDRVVAWVLTERASAELTSELAAILPAYMVPSPLVVVDVLPLNHTGKLDRRALVVPEIAVSGDSTAPRTDTERIVADAYAQVLGSPVDDVHADFFALGGHSLLAIRVINRLRTRTGHDLPLRTLFDAPTVAGLAAQLDAAGPADAEIVELRALEASTPALSFGQERLLTLYEIGGASSMYNVPLLWRPADGTRIDHAALSAALTDVVGRHRILRTRYPSTGPVVETDPLVRVQRVDDPSEFVGASAHVFDLAASIPVYVRATDDAAIITIHHIATDEWSAAPLRADLDAAYAARSAGHAPEWDELPLQYDDFAAWQRAYLSGARRERQLDFWRDTLAGTPEELALPYDRPRPARPSGRGDGVFVVLPTDLVVRLRALADATGTSMFMLMQAAVSVLLSRLGAGTDIPLGTPVTLRNDERLDRLVGFFLNTLVLRGDLSGDPDTRELLRRTRVADLAAFDHRDIPFEQVVESVEAARSPSLNPLFQTMVVYVEGMLPELDENSDLNALGLPAPTTAKFDLSFDFTEDASGPRSRVAGVIEYSTDLFDRGTVEAMAQRLRMILEFMASSPDVPLSSLDIRVPAERRDRTRPAPAPRTVVELFDDAVAEHADRPALRGPDGTRTFAELGVRVRSIAAALSAEGIGPEDVVAIGLPRGVAAVEAILGVICSGAAYLPFEPETPAERVASMMGLAGARRVVDSLDDPVLHAAEEPAWRPPALHPENPVYVIFTSGSTGTPKGVAVPHRGLANLFASHRRMLHEPARTRTGRRHLRVGHAWSLAFDASWQPQLWLFDGHEVSVVDADTQRDPDALSAQLREERWDFLELTPSHLARLGEAGESLPAIGFGGEAVPDAQWQRLRLLPDSDAYNLYGPTEATVDALVARVGDTEHPVVGGPVDGARAYVLDAHLSPVADGVDGELYLSGAGLARGYVGRGDLTSERFVADPFAADGSRMYRTGDTVRWTREGHLEYRGRGDDQVKIRGFRVELGEVEAAIDAVPGVASSLAVARSGRLVAYVVADADTAGTLDGRGLRRAVRDRLPDYMIPAAIVVLDALPTLPNGKIDRKSLPEPVFDAAVRPARTPHETRVCAAIADVLGLPHDRVGLDEDFIELGGDSIVAMQLVTRLRAEGMRISPREVMEHRTGGEIAECVAAAGDVPELEAVASGPVPATPIVRWLDELAETPEQVAGFHQSAFLVTPPHLDVDAVHAAMTLLTRRHHMLRARLVADAAPWRFEIPDATTALDTVAPVTVERGVDIGDRDAVVGVARRARARLDPQAGTMTTLTWIDRGDEPGRLLVQVHHLVVDGVSWRVLVPELIAAYEQIVAGAAPEAVALGAPSSDFGAWARGLVSSVPQDTREAATLWHHVIGDVAAVDALFTRPLDRTVDRQGGARTLRVSVPAHATARLLGPLPAALGVGVDELLLAAFGVAAGTSTLVDLESHGREEHLVPGAELGSTVGWFTAVHPIRVGGDGDVVRQARALSAERAQIPDGGVGYGLLRHVAGVDLPSAAIEFNYLGRYRSFAAGGWAMAPESAEVGPGEDMPAGHGLVLDVAAVDVAPVDVSTVDVAAVDEEGTVLNATWTYQPGVIDDETVAAIAARWVDELTTLASTETSSGTDSSSTDSDSGTDRVVEARS